MSDRNPRTITLLKSISADIAALRAEQQSSFAALDVELEEHKERLDGHDETLSDHERRLRRLEGKRADK